MLWITHPSLARASIQIIATVKVHTWLISEHFNDSTTRRMVHSANLNATTVYQDLGSRKLRLEVVDSTYWPCLTPIFYNNSCSVNLNVRVQPFIWKWVQFVCEWNLIFIGKVGHQDLLWKRGLRQLGNGQLHSRNCIGNLQSLFKCVFLWFMSDFTVLSREMWNGLFFVALVSLFSWIVIIAVKVNF